MRETEEGETTTTTEAVVYEEPTPTLPVEPVVEVVAEPAQRRIVKLAGEQTMWLVEDGIRRAFTNSGDAAALRIAPEVVDEDTLRQWPEGDVYTQ